MHPKKLLLVQEGYVIEWEIEDPLMKDVQLQGKINRSDVLTTFAEFDWDEMQRKDDVAQKGVFFHSPGICFKDRTNNLEVSFSLIGENKEYEFLVFFMRRKTVKGFLGFGEKLKTVVSDQCDVSFTDCKAILKAYIDLDSETLENRDWK